MATLGDPADHAGGDRRLWDSGAMELRHPSFEISHGFPHLKKRFSEEHC
jgi:hypothetical protein